MGSAVLTPFVIAFGQGMAVREPSARTAALHAYAGTTRETLFSQRAPTRWLSIDVASILGVDNDDGESVVFDPVQDAESATAHAPFRSSGQLLGSWRPRILGEKLDDSLNAAFASGGSFRIARAATGRTRMW